MPSKTSDASSSTRTHGSTSRGGAAVLRQTCGLSIELRIRVALRRRDHGVGGRQCSCDAADYGLERVNVVVRRTRQDAQGRQGRQVSCFPPSHPSLGGPGVLSWLPGG